MAAKWGPGPAGGGSPASGGGKTRRGEGPGLAKARHRPASGVPDVTRECARATFGVLWCAREVCATCVLRLLRFVAGRFSRYFGSIWKVDGCLYFFFQVGNFCATLKVGRVSSESEFRGFFFF